MRRGRRPHRQLPRHERDDVEDYWPPIPDHWAAYGLAETVEFPERDPERPLTDAELAHARRQAGLFGSQVRWVSQQAGPWGRACAAPRCRAAAATASSARRWPGCGAPPGPTPASTDARAGSPSGPSASPGWPSRSRTTARTPGSRPSPTGRGSSTASRAWTTSSTPPRRCCGTLAIVEAGPGTGHDEPNRWLWALALIATLNPVFVALGVPRRARPARAGVAGRRRRARRSLLVLLAAGCPGPLLDALDVSPAAARLAVGIVGAVAGLVRMVRRPPRPQPAPPGLRAAVVPVAVPLFAAPALILLGLGAGADLGMAFVAACLAVGVGAAGRRRRRAARGRTVAHGGPWAHRLVCAVAAVACILLVVSGVLAI